MLKSSILILTALTLANLGTARAQSTPAAGGLTDPQIAMIAVTADSVDIDAGKLAEEKASSKEVKDFGATMVRDHTAVNAKATALAKKLNLTPEESATSKSLKADGDAMLTKLKGLSGAAFDNAYVDNEVAYHEKVIEAVTKTLIPNTKNAELKALLESAGPIFTSHLEHAKRLQASLKK
jgi:putative membrane protein